MWFSAHHPLAFSQAIKWSHASHHGLGYLHVFQIWRAGRWSRDICALDRSVVYCRDQALFNSTSSTTRILFGTLASRSFETSWFRRLFVLCPKVQAHFPLSNSTITEENTLESTCVIAITSPPPLTHPHLSGRSLATIHLDDRATLTKAQDWKLETHSHQCKSPPSPLTQIPEEEEKRRHPYTARQKERKQGRENEAFT